MPPAGIPVNMTGPGWAATSWAYGEDFGTVLLSGIADVLQRLTLGIRLDMGVDLSNNPFMNATWVSNNFPEYSPVEFNAGPAFLMGDYQCRFRYPLPWGQISSTSG